MSQPAGWYHAESDPPGSYRYWDGTQWQGEPMIPATSGAGGDATGGGAGGGPGYPVSGGFEGFSSISELFKKAFILMRSRLGALVGLLIFFVLGAAASYAVLFAGTFSAFDNTGTAETFWGRAIFFFVVFLILMSLVQSAYSLITSSVMNLQLRGRPSSISAGWAASRQRLIGYWLTATGMYLLISFGIGIVGAILGYIHPVLQLVTLPAYLFAWVKLGFMPVAAAATSRGTPIVGTSASVSEGSRFWPVLGRMLVGAIPGFVVYIGFFTVLIVSARQDAFGVAIVSLLLLIPAFIACFLLYQAVMVVIYKESGARSNV